MEEGISIKANLIIALQTSNIQAFETVVKTSDVPLYNLKDSHGCNIFHDLAISVVKEEVLIEMLNVLITEFNDRYFEDSEDYMRFMLNCKKQNDGRTPLLDAVYYNKRKIAKKFIQLGSDPLIKANDGQGAVHFAASSGFDYLLVYLVKDLGVPSDDIDNTGKSPLHLACIKGHYTAAAFLVAWGADVNLVDSSGNSALHFAVSSQNYKLVRLLLVRGSRKNIRNRTEHRPVDLALGNMSGDIVDLINSPSCLARLNPFAQNVSSSGNSPIKFIIFTVIFAFRAVFQVVFILYLDQQVIYYLSLFLIFLSITSFLMVSCKSPGYLAKKCMNLNELIEKYRPEFICPFCECKKNHGTRHCFICKRCVEKMDHHCPWLNNCIGKKNYNFFVIFLVLGSLDYFFHTVICLLEMFRMIHVKIDLISKQNLVLLISSVISFILFIIIFPVLCIHIFNIIKQKRNKMKITPNRLDSSDTSSMFVTPSISAADTSSSLMSDSTIRVKKRKSCFRFEKNHEVSLMTRRNLS